MVFIVIAHIFVGVMLTLLWQRRGRWALGWLCLGVPPTQAMFFLANPLAIAAAVFVLTTNATPAAAQNALPKIADQWGCPSQGHFHFCSRNNATTVRMQCPYGCNYIVVGDDSFEDAADGYVYVPKELVPLTKGAREY